MTTTQYYAAKALGVCPRHPDRAPEAGHYHCTECLEYFSPNRRFWQAVRAQRPAAAVPTSANLVACCDQWHKIVSVPFTAPCCGRRYFTE